MLLVSDLAEGAALSAAVNLVVASVSASLGVRAAAIRVVVSDAGLELHGLFRTRFVRWPAVSGFEQYSFLGRPANYLSIAGGRRVLLPLLMQIAVPTKLAAVRDQLAAWTPAADGRHE